VSDGTITRAELNAAVRAATRVPGPPVNIDREGDEAWVTIGDRPARLLVGGPDPERTLRREGWRARLVAIEALLADPDVAEGLDDWTDGNFHTPRAKVEEAAAAVRALIDGDVGGDGLVNLSRDDFDRVETWWNVADGEGYFDDDTDATLLDRLRREVGA